MTLIARTKRSVIVRLERALSLPDLRSRLDEAEQQVEREAAQLAALEERVADQLVGARGVAEPLTDLALVEQVHREHRRMRERMVLVTHYVSRLERLEAALGLTGDSTQDPNLLVPREGRRS